MSWSGDDLLLEADGDDLLALAPNDLELMYERIVYAYPSTAARYRAAHRLAQFHGYLYAHHHAKEVDFDTLLLDVGDMTANVDVNLVTPPEYRRILSYLGWGKKQLPRIRTMQIIVTILMFRCGLRRSEVHGLRIIDVQNEIAPCLLIRAHRYADTKSLSARRIIPLESLLEPEELRFVLSWVTKRNKESKTSGNTLLLHDPTAGPSYVPGSLLFGPVTEALHKVTGDRTLHPHNLRHSFACWLIVRLGMRDDIAIANLPAALHDPIFSSAERRLLKKRLFANEFLGRKYLYAVKMLLGHSDVRTTIYNYMHVMDWMLGYLTRHESWLPNLSIAAEKQVSTTGHTAVFSARRQARGKSLSLLKLAQNASSHHRDQLTGTFPVRRGRPPTAAATTDRLTLPSFEEALDRLSQSVGEPGRPLPPAVPKYRQELVYAAELYGQLRGLTGSARTIAHRTLRTAFVRFDRETNEVVVDSTTWGREFAQTLRALKIPPSCWVLSHHPRKGQDPEEASNYQKKWAETLGVAQGTITTGLSAKGPRKGRLALKICRPPAPVKGQQKGERQRAPTERRLARYGFHFFLLMVGRALGD